MDVPISYSSKNSQNSIPNLKNISALVPALLAKWFKENWVGRKDMILIWLRLNLAKERMEEGETASDTVYIF